MTITVAALLGAFYVFLSVVFGTILGIVLRKFHDRPFRVGVGAAYFMLLMYLLMILPAMLIVIPAEDSDSWKMMLWMLPGASLLLALLLSGWIRHVPIFGGPLISYMLATTRMQAAMSKRQVEKFEKLESRKLSRATA